MIYDYSCSCGDKIMVDFPRGKAQKTKKCYNCGKKMRRVFSMPVVRFVGQGWVGKTKREEQPDLI